MKCYVLCLRHLHRTGYELSVNMVTTDKDKAVSVYNSYIEKYGKYGKYGLCDGQELQEWNEEGNDYIILMSTD